MFSDDEPNEPNTSANNTTNQHHFAQRITEPYLDRSKLYGLQKAKEAIMQIQWLQVLTNLKTYYYKSIFDNINTIILFSNTCRKILKRITIPKL